MHHRLLIESFKHFLTLKIELFKETIERKDGKLYWVDGMFSFFFFFLIIIKNTLKG